MIDRFLKFKLIVKSITSTAESLIEGIKKNDAKKLKDLMLTDSEWELIEVLRELLKPFAEATTLLSGTSYPTLPIAKFIHKMLEIFLNQQVNNESREDKKLSPNTLIDFNLLKSILLGISIFNVLCII